jgi:UDP-glucose 4-epimerase
VAALLYNGSNTFNVGTGLEHDVNYLFHTLREFLYPACPENHGPSKLGEQKRSVITYTKIQKELGWKPTVSLKEGLRITAEYFGKTERR